MTYQSAVTLGESLGLVHMAEVGPVRSGDHARVSFAGAESNVAIGLARLGHRVSYVSRVGSDAIGRMVTEVLRGEQIDVSHVIQDSLFPTALMLREHRTSELLRVAYFRSGSACARLAPEDIPLDLVTSADLIHVSGITLGLSDSARAAAEHAISAAHAAGVLVSFDVNYRRNLWSPRDAASTLGPLLDRVDVVFGGQDELALLCAQSSCRIANVAASILASNPTAVVCKQGGAGATVFDESGSHRAPAIPVNVVDPVGAGDAFVAGYLSAVLDGETAQDCLHRATQCGAFCVAVPGDWEGLPRRDELNLLSISEKVQR